MGGLLLTSIISGRIISRTGKYRLFPILGTLLGVTGMVLLTRITIHSPLWQLYLFTGVLGAGLGLVMQVLVLAVQNAMPAQMYGVATSGVTLFRSIGAPSAWRCLARCSRTCCRATCNNCCRKARCCRRE